MTLTLARPICWVSTCTLVKAGLANSAAVVSLKEIRLTSSGTLIPASLKAFRAPMVMASLAAIKAFGKEPDLRASLMAS